MRSFIGCLGLGVLAAACAPSGADVDRDSAELSGPVSVARACVVKKVYASATLRTLTPIAKSDLPPGVTATNPLSLSSMEVPGVGRVYIVEEAASTSFYDRRGLLVGRATNTDPIVWSQPTGDALTCEGDEPPPPSSPLDVRKLLDGTDFVLLAVAGDDAIYRSFSTSSEASKVYAVPVTGGAPTLLFELGVNAQIDVSNRVVAHYRNISAGAATLDVWSRRSGLVTDVASRVPVKSLKGSPDGKRIVFGQDATFDGSRPNAMTIAMRDITNVSGVTTILADGAYRANLASPVKCPFQMSFAGNTLVAEYCLGTSAAQSLARLVTLPPDAYTFRRIDGADEASANSLAGDTKFSTDARAEHVLVAQATATGGRAAVYDLTGSGYSLQPAGSDYTLLPSGRFVLYRTATNDLMSAPTGAGNPILLASGVKGLLGVSPDGERVLFRKTERDATSKMVDINIVSTAGTTPSTLLSPKALELGFSGDAKNVFYISAASNPASGLMSAPVDSLTPKVLMKEAVGGRVTSGSGVLAFSAVKPASASFPTVARVSFIDDRGHITTLSSDVPLDPNDSELFLAGQEVVFTDLGTFTQGLLSARLP